MHQHPHPRPPPRSSSAASNPSTNPERTNNQRDQLPPRTRSSVDLASYTERVGGEVAAEQPRAEGPAATPQDRETTKLNQIIQHFHSKAALMICSARASLPQAYTRSGEVKQNRWFNSVLDETDALLDDLQEWKRPDLSDRRPPPLVIEVYVDTAQLSQSQALVIVDDAGQRWDVCEALAGSSTGSSLRPGHKNGAKVCEVVLERWTIQLGSPAGYTPAELNDQLPNVYKKGVVLFRSLYTLLRFLPAWKLYRRLARQPGNGQGLRLKYRIRKGGRSLPKGEQDALLTPLCPSDIPANTTNVTGSGTTPSTNSSGQQALRHEFDLHCPAGPLGIVVDSRSNQDLRVVDAEATLSSRFVGLDDGLPTLAGRSLPGARTQHSITQSRTQYGSAAESRITQRQPRALLGAYGSLGTFHATGNRQSPISALKHISTPEDNDYYDDNMDRRNALRDEARQGSGKFTGGNSPFKAGSLASSPRDIKASPTPPQGTNPNSPHGRTSFLKAISEQKDEIRSTGNPARKSSTEKRVSLNTLPQQALRAPSNIPNETAIASSASTSPRPAPLSRYSTSFPNRPRRQPSAASQTNRSGGSAESSARGSASDQAGGGSSGASATKTDDEDIQDFISLLEKSKTLSISRTPPRPHTINLAKYTSMRDSSNQVADEMSASSLIQASSSTPPSRRLSNVPGLSTSSSPSRALAHAPHVRSRLSTQSIAEEGTRAAESPRLPEEEGADEDEPFIFPMGMNM